VSLAPEACPPSWPALRLGPPNGTFDGNVSVFAGGDLRVSGAALGAEGTVVALGDATIARDVPGPYEVGVTALGSQVSPYPGSDMLVVGGTLAGGVGTHVDVGQGLGGDVVVGGAEAEGTDLDPHGGRVDTQVADATAAYVGLTGQLAAKSAAYAALPASGTVDVTDEAITLTGDGTSAVQVFDIDADTLGPADGAGRSLQVVGVPQDAALVVNLTGSAVALNIDSVLSTDGAVVDPLTDPYFAALATHVLWNVPSAATVDVGGLAELPGSLLVPTPGSTTTLSGLGTNGRIMVAGDLVHTGVGELHAYPFLADAQLGCAADPVHLTTLKLDVLLVDHDGVVDRDRYFEGRFECTLGGVDVTPADHTWKLRAGAPSRTLSDQIPAGASCTVTERLDAPPAPFRAWAEPAVQPGVLVAAKREEGEFSITNRVRELPPAATDAPDPVAPTPTPTATPGNQETEAPEPPPLPPSSTPAPSATPTSSIVEPTNGPDLPSSPSAAATPAASPTPTAASHAPEAEPPRQAGPAGALSTTAPFTLRGAFVWGPMLMLSLLTLLLRVRRRPRRVH
jgi:choice-of-anchor A domain-containing protein